MALNIPMPDLPGTGFLQGLDTGSNMFAKLMNARYNNALHPSGDVANAMYVEQLKSQYGPNDPRYLQAARAHEMGLASRQSLMDYRTQLSNLAPYRAATPEEKLIAARQGRGSLQTFGGMGLQSNEGGTYNLPPEEEAIYNAALGKKTTDAAIRNKIPYAENVKITMDSIVPEHLVQYSGPKGRSELTKDTLKAAFGQPSERFMQYNQALTGAKTLSKQLRQFWGDSIQPSAVEQIDKLTNPSHWLKSPEIALQQFNQLKKITDQELQVFKTAGNTPGRLNYKNNQFQVNDSLKPRQKAQVQPNFEFESEPEPEAQTMNLKNPSKEDLNLLQVESQLLQINPNYTAENIKATAKKRGISINDVIKQLMKQTKRGM